MDNYLSTSSCDNLLEYISDIIKSDNEEEQFDIAKILSHSKTKEFGENFSMMFIYNKLFICSTKIKTNGDYDQIGIYELDEGIKFTSNSFCTNNTGLLYHFSEVVKGSVLETGLTFTDQEVSTAKGKMNEALMASLDYDSTLEDIGKKEKISPKIGRISVSKDEEVFLVGQSEAGLIDGDSSQQYIETIGAGPCVILYFYNVSTRKVYLSHLDGSIDYNRVVDEYQRCGSCDEIFAGVFGGDSSSRDNLVKLYKSLSEKNIEIRYLERGDGISSKNIIVDKKSGVPYNSIGFESRGGNQDSDLKSLQIQSRVFEGRMNGGQGLMPIFLKVAEKRSNS